MRLPGFLAVATTLLGQTAAAEDPMELQRCIWRCLASNGPATNPAYHRCVDQLCIAATPAPPAQTTPWSFISVMMAQVLDVRPGEGAPKLFPDHADPVLAQNALGFHYFRNRYGGTMIEMNVGLFQQIEGGWRYSGPVLGLFGVEPRDVSFSPGRIDLTTTVHGFNEPQCCPSTPARWSVNIATRTVARLQ
ncbi:hypothetical protein ACOTTU_15300 [Roseobacter sp. EG26]|uniref:hypothetical protein n=1 Tax=Roseobacter sp. EG26 TaxID=3412477 RepID=UPI003CE530A9